MNKTAKEMFEELGWNINVEKNYIICYEPKLKIEIVFDVPCKDVNIWYSLIENKELMKAINQQCKELGWLDE